MKTNKTNKTENREVMQEKETRKPPREEHQSSFNQRSGELNRTQKEGAQRPEQNPNEEKRVAPKNEEREIKRSAMGVNNENR